MPDNLPHNLPDDFISPAETAADLNVTEATLASWRSTGRGPDFWKFGRSISYSRRVNREWKAQQRRSPGPRSESTASMNE
jgi:hypothetical protein